MGLATAAANKYSTEQRRKCISCGFFSQHGHGNAWYEVLPPARAESDLPYRQNDNYPPPACFRFAFDLSAEYAEGIQQLREANGGAPIENAYGEVVEDLRPIVSVILSRDRDCPDWYPYTPGLSPREHLDQYQMMQLTAEERAHELRLAQIEAEGRASLEKIEADSLKIATATSRFTTRWTYAAFAVAIALLVLGMVAYIWPRR